MSFSRTWSWPGAGILLLGASVALASRDANGAELFARVVIAMIAGLTLGLASVLIVSIFSPRKG